MIQKKINHRGFTLIEIITSIVVLSIISFVMVMGFVEILKGYMLSKKNAIVTQQGQIVMARLKKELASSSSITCGSSNMITYKIKRNASGTENVTIYWTGGGNPLRLRSNSDCLDCATSCTRGDILADNIDTFTLSYCTSMTNCSSNYSVATVAFVNVYFKLKGYDDTKISIADPDVVMLNLETGN